MNVTKQVTIALAVSLFAIGFTTVVSNVEASYGYAYTDSIRPPVETPTNDAFRKHMVEENQADNARHEAITSTSNNYTYIDDSKTDYYDSSLSDSIRSFMMSLCQSMGFSDHQLRMLGLIR